MQVANPNRAQFQKNSIFIPSDFPHFLKSTIGKELAPSKSAPVTPSPILLKLLTQINYTRSLKRFSIQCRKTKTKVITPTNHKNVNNTKNQSEQEANACNRCQARENARQRGTTGLVLLLIG